MKYFNKKILKTIFPDSFWKRLFRTSIQLISSDYLARHGFYSMNWSLINLKKLGYNPNTVIDIGAYEGEWTKNTMNIFTNASFLLIEPQPQKKDMLLNFASKNDRIYFSPYVAAAKDDEDIEFTIQKTGSSVFEQLYEGKTEKKKIYLKTKTVDAILDEQGLPGEFFLKLDVQGYEIEVLKGAPKILEQTNVVFLEASLLNYNLNAPLIAEIMIFMKNQGFLLFDIAELSRDSLNMVLNQVDLIFCREDWEIRRQANYL